MLAAVGVYGVLAFSISRRTREMGIRLALGAERRDVFLLVLRDGMLVVGIGVALGLAAGASGAHSLASFLYGVPTLDLLTFVVTTVVLLAVAFVACTIPARRAMRVSPIAAIRCE
jgi:ABC-type antimicrobial peptide transport system permease subunit